MSSDLNSDPVSGGNDPRAAPGSSEELFPWDARLELTCSSPGKQL